MDCDTYFLAINKMKSLPDNAASSAEAAAASALAAQEAAESVETATVAEAKEYLGIT